LSLKISQLTAATAGAGADQVPVNRAGSNFSVSADQIHKLGIVSAKDNKYGVVGDGVADDTAALKAAFADARAVAGGKLYIPRGTYKFTTSGWVLFDNSGWYDGFELFGDGMGATILQASGVSLSQDYNGVFSVNSYSNSVVGNTHFHKIHDLTIRGDPNASGAGKWRGIFLNGCFQCEIYRVEMSGVAGNVGANFPGASGMEVGNPTWDQAEFVTTLGTAVSSNGSHTVTPGSMTGIYPGRRVWIGGANPETVLVTSVTATTFTATFAAQPHLAADPLILRCDARAYHNIHDCYFHDFPYGTGILFGNGCTVRNNRFVNIGSNGSQHAMYCGSGENWIEDNYIEAVGGTGIHIHYGVATIDGWGNRIRGNEIVNPAFAHISIDNLGSDGTNPELPLNTPSARAIAIHGNTLRCSQGYVSSQLNAGLQNTTGISISGAAATITGNLFEDAGGYGGSGWIYGDPGDVGTMLTVSGNTFRQRTTQNITMCTAGVRSTITGNIVVLNDAGSNGLFGSMVTGNWIQGTCKAACGAYYVCKDNVVSLTSGICVDQAGASGTDIASNYVVTTGDAFGINGVAGLIGTETLNIHDNTIAAGGYLTVGTSSKQLKIYDNNGVICYTGKSSGAIACDRLMGTLIAQPKGTNTLSKGLLVKFASAALITITTSDTVFLGAPLSDTDAVSNGVYIAGRIGTEFQGLLCDNAWTEGNVGIASTTAAGKIHDTGSQTPPAAPASYVVFLDTGGGAGSARVLFQRTV
jgi:hypothetical protein